jgi:ArsR family transcriptional regulator
MRVESFEALGDARRLGIVKLLARGELCLCHISAALGISDALASHHVKRLRDAGLVRTRRKGLWLHCSLDPAAVEALSEGLASLAGQAASSSGSRRSQPARAANRKATSTKALGGAGDGGRGAR